MKSNYFNPPRGTRDLSYSDVLIRQYIFNILKKSYSSRDAIMIDTPIIEINNLSDIYGEDLKKLYYSLNSDTKEPLILRYDLTLPLMRYVANNQIRQIKRYQIGKVYRKDTSNIKNKKYIEFYQCDYDIVSDDSDEEKCMYQDLEVLDLLVEVLNKLIGNTYTIKLNHKQIIIGILKKINIDPMLYKTVCSTLNKLDKYNIEYIKHELSDKNIPDNKINSICAYINEIKAMNNTSNNVLLKYLLKHGIIEQRIFNNLDLLFKNLCLLKIDNKIKLSPLLSLEIDYYTGIIYEAKYNDKKIISSSIATGGRYDNMINIKPLRKAIGLSIRIERIVTILEKTKFKINFPTLKVYVATVGKNMSQRKFFICTFLRRHGIKTTMSFSKNPEMRKQLDYVLENKIPYMIIISKNESNDKVKFKDINKNKEHELSLEEVICLLKK